MNGFKSFAQKVEILFEGNGVTAIVGPNGCGKSNIVDAILWVMGEQNANQLRVEKKEGFIFAGTADRPAMNMAEVSLVIENDKGLLPSEYSEVMTTRKVFSNGMTENSINNQECLLSDIKNLFADTGVGAGSFHMDRRAVDALLSDKADERRLKLDEVAGVSLYKKRQKTAKAMLEKNQQNMEIIAVNLQNAKNQFKQQERMLGRAQELRKLKSRLKELDVSITLVKYRESKESQHTFSMAKIKGGAELETLKLKLMELETKIEEKHLLIAGDEENLKECEREVSNAKIEIAKLNEAYIYQQNSEKELEENKIRCEREISDSEKDILALKDEMQALENDLKNANPEIEEIIKRGKKETEILQSQRNSVDSLRIRHRELSNKRVQFTQSAGNLRMGWQKTDAEMEMLGERINQAKKEIESIDSKIQEFEHVKNGKETEIDQSKNKSELLAERHNVLEGEREDLSESLDVLLDQKMEASNEKTRWESRLEALQSVSENPENLEGNKWLLEQNLADGAVLLSNRIEVLDGKYTALVEFCLGSSVHALLMQNQESVLACAQALESGRALLAWNTNSIESPVQEPDAVPLTSLVKCSADSLLSKYFLVKDIETAVALAQKYSGKDVWFCTEDCRAINAAGLAKIGRETKENFGVLQQNAEIKKLQAEIASVNEKINSIETQMSDVENKQQEISIQYSNISEEKRAIDAHIIKVNSEIEIIKANISAVNAQKEKIQQDISNFETRLGELKSSRDSDTQLNVAELELEQAEREFAVVDGELAEQERMFKNQEELVAELANSLNASKLKLSERENRLVSVREQIQTKNNALVIRNEELSGISDKKELLQRELEGKAIQIENEQEKLTNKENLRDRAQEKYTVMAGDIEEWRSEVREINRSLQEKGKTAHDLDLAMKDSLTSLERMREDIFREHEFDLEKDSAEQDFTPLQIDERDANIEMHELRERIKSIGPINPTAAEDFEAEKEKMLEVQTQYDDLLKAKNSLETAMKRLDIVARDRFLDTFNKIKHNFQEVFSYFMPGGEALITMRNNSEDPGEPDPLEAEIEINARPTGKKMMGVKILSDGEKALTATSLLFALYMVKPSPFCILDEIDGPLDDANIGRFMGILRRFSHQTQFVVITHNKRTMAAADKLYGVTQEIKGISKIGSVRLEDINS